MLQQGCRESHWYEDRKILARWKHFFECRPASMEWRRTWGCHLSLNRSRLPAPSPLLIAVACRFLLLHVYHHSISIKPTYPLLGSTAVLQLYTVRREWISGPVSLRRGGERLPHLCDRGGADPRCEPLSMSPRTRAPVFITPTRVWVMRCAFPASSLKLPQQQKLIASAYQKVADPH